MFDSSATTSSEFHGPLAINNPPSVGATDVVQINGGIIATGSGEFRLSSSAGLVEVGAISQNYWSLPSYSGSLLRFYGSTNGSTFAGVSTNSLGALIFQNVANCLIGSNGPAPLTFMMASNAVGTITAAGQWVIGASDPQSTSGPNFRVSGQGFFGGNSTTSPGATSTVTGMRIGNDVNGAPMVAWNQSSNGTDSKSWDILQNTSSLYFRLLNDAYTSATSYLTLTRSGMTLGQAAWTVSNYSINDPGGSQAFRVGASGLFQGTLTVQNAGTTDRLVLQGAAVGSSSNTLTVITPATAMGANFQQTLQARTGIVALQGEGLWTNILHNGDVQVDQRGSISTPISLVTGTLTYGPDGWAAFKSNVTQVLSISQGATPVGLTGSEFCCRLAVTTGASLATTDSISLIRQIEGRMFNRVGFGLSTALPLYLSFYLYANVTGTFSASLRNGPTNRSFVTNFTIAATNTWTKFQVTFPGDTTGTWPAAGDTTLGASLALCFGAGSTLQTSAGAWVAGNYVATSGTTNFGASACAIYVTDLYLGTTPIGTGFADYPRLPYDMELQRCKRYFQSYVDPVLRGVSNSSTQLYRIGMLLPVAMRAAPTSAVSGTFNWTDGNGTGTITSAGTRYTSTTGFEWDAVLATGASATGRASCTSLGGGGILTLSAEL